MLPETAVAHWVGLPYKYTSLLTSKGGLLPPGLALQVGPWYHDTVAVSGMEPGVALTE